MFLFQICVIALCAVRRCQAMITLETIKNLQQSESKFMNMVFLEGTCYTDVTKRCVGISNVVVDYQKYGVIPPFTVTESLSHNILFTQNSLTASGQLPDSFMAFVLINYSGRVVGKSLIDVVQDCVSQERYVQAFIRFMNVIESVGISMLWRFCEISKIISEKSKKIKMTIYYDMVDRLITHIDKAFTNYFISTEPLRQIKTAIIIARINDKYTKEYFINTCTEYGQRYVNMIDLVHAGEFKNFESLTNGHRTTDELKYIITLGLHYFEKETDIELVSGGDAHVLNQLKSEDTNRQL